MAARRFPIPGMIALGLAAATLLAQVLNAASGVRAETPREAAVAFAETGTLILLIGVLASAAPAWLADRRGGSDRLLAKLSGGVIAAAVAVCFALPLYTLTAADRYDRGFWSADRGTTRGE